VIKQLSIRQWFVLSWLLCLLLPRLLFELVEQIQHWLVPSIGDIWLIGPLGSAVLTLVLTLLGVGWLIDWAVLKPLDALRQAAHQIATGDLDIAVPASPVLEVNQVVAAFVAMGGGLREAITRQAALEQERRMFVSAIAHDLRTPLFALRGYIDGLEQGLAATPEKIAGYLSICREQAAALDQRITALFDYARLEYLEQPLRRETLRWGELVEQTVARVQPLAALKGVCVRVTGLAESGALDGDPQLLMRMLENLLDNAIRHSPPDGAVEVQWQIEPGQLRFSVADSGAGIASEELPHIFLPMYRGEPSRSRATGGAGLGLAIAQRIAQAHGGHLSVANRPGGGAELSGWLSCSAREPAG
jgi:signal transduction histidine kinase